MIKPKSVASGLVLVVALLHPMRHPAQELDAKGDEIRVSKSGPWQVASGVEADTRTAHGWVLEGKLDARRGVLTGEVVVEGSPLVRVGTVEARIDGEAVIGSVRDKGGKDVASITGRLDGHGASGKFEDRTGGVGSWSFRGVLPTTGGQLMRTTRRGS